LIPKKHKDILRKLIEEKGYDKSFTEDAVSFYWSEVRKSLSELAAPSITVRRLGTFQIKDWKVDEFIESYRRHLETHEGFTFREFKYRRQMENQYNNFIKLKQDLAECEKKKQGVKHKRSEYENNKSLGQQGQDNGGSGEQPLQEG
jgi:hypothetical protein